MKGSVVQDNVTEKRRSPDATAFHPGYGDPETMKDEQEICLEKITLYAQQKRLSSSTLARWHAWSASDQAALWEVVHELQLGENHLRDFLEWCEEITLRDGGTIAALLARPEFSPALRAKLGRHDKLKVVKEALRRVRYPQLSRLEDNVRAAIKALDLGSLVQISFPPLFEGDEITVSITARNVKELQDSVDLVRKRLDDGALQRLFALREQV